MNGQILPVLILAFPSHACGDSENQLVQNGKAGNVMKILGFKSRTGAPLDRRNTRQQSLRVRNM